MADRTTILWQKFSSRILRFIESRVQDKCDAEDLLQDAFVKIHRALPNLKDFSKLESWIFQLTRNVINDYYRSQGRSIMVKNQEPGFDLLADSEDPALNQPQTLNCLIPFIMALPPIYRHALYQTDILEISQKSMASEAGITYSAMKSRVQRAREMLKRSFMECCNLAMDSKGYVTWDQDKIDNCPRCLCT